MKDGIFIALLFFVIVVLGYFMTALLTWLFLIALTKLGVEHSLNVWWTALIVHVVWLMFFKK